ncbi:potassium channel family protein [Falsibacillus pallidus]|uniref:potassium channel family protein n=1 Tax=Falsibacillus pallidus TaxID=493781 RepID=UPI003D97924E
MLEVFMGAVVICMMVSIRNLFLPSKMKQRHVSLENFLFISLIYLTLMIGFGLLYMALELQGVRVLADNSGVAVDSFLNKFMTYVYFSGMTLFSVGYGDVIPVEAGRVLVILEALIGYTIPAAFVVRTVLDIEKPA